MKVIFKWLLRHYTQTRKSRIEVFKMVTKQAQQDYYNQNEYGVFYESCEEFFISSNLLKECIIKSDYTDISNIENGVKLMFKNSITELRSIQAKEK